MIKKLIILSALLGICLLAPGCSSNNAPAPGYSKADFAKTAPPANWPHGPGGANGTGAPPPPPPGAGAPGGAAGAGGK